MKALHLKDAKAALRPLSVTITYRQGEYRVNYLHGLEPTAYYTSDLEDAFWTGVEYAKHYGRPLPWEDCYGPEAAAEISSLRAERDRMREALIAHADWWKSQGCMPLKRPEALLVRTNLLLAAKPYGRPLPWQD